MLTFNCCDFCKGNGKAQRLEERRDYGWFPNRQLSHELADAWIKAEGDRAPIRWTDCACPRCGGDGSVAVEHFAAKIF